MKTLTALVTGALLAVAISASASASTLIIGAPGLPVTGNTYPFGSPYYYWSGEYQQVYAASAFSGPITITGISFYNYNDPGGSLATGTYTLSLSTTSAGVGGLASPLSSNLGSDNTSVFTGSLPALASSMLTFSLSTPFSYNPAAGNLLLDVVSSDANNTGIAIALDDALNSPYSSRAWGPNHDNYALVTGFTYQAATPVPEPATLALFGAGLIGFGAVRRRKRKAA